VLDVVELLARSVALPAVPVTPAPTLEVGATVDGRPLVGVGSTEER
jgi:hypothetical protein